MKVTAVTVTNAPGRSSQKPCLNSGATCYHPFQLGLPWRNEHAAQQGQAHESCSDPVSCSVVPCLRRWEACYHAFNDGEPLTECKSEKVMVRKSVPQCSAVARRRVIAEVRCASYDHRSAADSTPWRLPEPAPRVESLASYSST
jgi:hypothetical protein